MIWKFTKVAMAAFGLLGAASSAGANPSEPTCSDILEIEVHGQHVIGDYVTGMGHDVMGWPPEGSEVGDVVSTNGGVAVRGGPGPGFHFENGIAPGASFCTNSESPGIHF